MVSKQMYPSSSMKVTITPISSMCPANITLGRPARLIVANELPFTSLLTPSANRSASVRHSRAGADSKADGPGVSSSDFRNVSDSGVMGMAECEEGEKLVDPGRDV